MNATRSALSGRVAILDGDATFVAVVGAHLQAAGWHQAALTSPASNGHLVAMRLNALVLDLACLGSARSTYLETVCEGLPTLGVVVCSGRSTVAERVRALRTGADDWLTKPCHPDELVARLEAITRSRMQAETPPAGTRFVSAELEIHRDQLQAFARGARLDLTRRELQLLALLAAEEGRVVAREEIYQRVWGYTMARGDRSVDVFVRKLRSKLRRASPGWRYIHTHFGVGYRFAPEPAAPGQTGAAPATPPGLDATVPVPPMLAR